MNREKMRCGVEVGRDKMEGEEGMELIFRKK